MAPAVPVRSLRQDTRARALREARTCYDHLAGRLGVRLMGTLIEREYLAGGDGEYDAAGPGRPSSRLRARGGLHADPGRAGVPGRVRGPDPAAAPADPLCVDWSEQAHHLSGALGRGLLDRVTELGWIQRSAGSRAVKVTDAGREGLDQTFGIPA